MHYWYPDIRTWRSPLRSDIFLSFHTVTVKTGTSPSTTTARTERLSYSWTERSVSINRAGFQSEEAINRTTLVLIATLWGHTLFRVGIGIEKRVTRLPQVTIMRSQRSTLDAPMYTGIIRNVWNVSKPVLPSLFVQTKSNRKQKNDFNSQESSTTKYISM